LDDRREARAECERRFQREGAITAKDGGYVSLGDQKFQKVRNTIYYLVSVCLSACLSLILFVHSTSINLFFLRWCYLQPTTNPQFLSGHHFSIPVAGFLGVAHEVEISIQISALDGI